MPIRQLSPYEKNHLLRYGFNPEKVDQYGEMPVEYITGKAIFLGREFVVSPDVLIPRVETEELVELIQSDLVQNQEVSAIRIADIGSGSGAIGLSLAVFLEEQKRHFTITLSDISEKALAVAEQNFHRLFAKLPKYGRMNSLRSDLLINFLSDEPFDLIIANLPYIPAARIPNLDVSVKDFEPLVALDGGEDGLEYIFRLLKQAKRVLKPGGKIYLELDDTQTAEKFQLFAENYQLHFFKDQSGKPRFAVFTLRTSL